MRKKKDETQEALEALKNCVMDGHNMKYVSIVIAVGECGIGLTQWVNRKCSVCGFKTRKPASEVELLAYEVLNSRAR